MLKKVVRQIALRTILFPPSVHHCSQTIYEALLGCCRMWEATKSAQWKERAERVFVVLRGIQQPDGGFDIGYDFNFGRLHKKGHSTSPELVGLLALSEYARLFGEKEADQPAHRAAEWIRERTLDMGDGKIAIPYSPYTINAVMIYNATSFACGSLGCYLRQFGGDQELRQIYEGMVRYLESVLSSDENLPGRFWYYFDQSRDDWDDVRRNKIDYYHQMQQVEMHARAQQSSPIDLQINIIRDAAEHVAALNDRHPVIPYTNNSRLVKEQIHLWGFASVASGMLEAAVVIPDRREAYHKVANDVLEWVINYAWTGDRFEAILNKDGSRVDPRHYMVRSDAWVFNALAAAAKQFGMGTYGDIAEKCYAKMESVDFSGPESHASRRSTRAVVSVFRMMFG